MVEAYPCTYRLYGQSIFEDLPKSCILCEEGGVRTLYISQLSTATLLRRSEQGAAE